MANTGTVYLVGAGPGDPGLITLKGLKCLQQSDVVIYDRLINPQLLKHAKPGAEIIYAGKSVGYHTMTQEEINFLLISKAREGKKVCRLKGGDPFVFGRGGEEAEALVKEGLHYEVVPGITSAIAAPAYAGIPVTQRGLTSSFAVITGHEDPTKEEGQLDWAALAKMGTLVCLMGAENLPNIVNKLIEHGRSPSTPAALVQWGTWPKQRVVDGTLSDIVQRAREAKLGPPAVTIIGEVAALRDKLHWFDNKPLFGKRVLVTRSREQASRLSELLAELGAEPLETPAIRIEEPEDYGPLDEAVGDIRSYQWIVFASVNGVNGFFRRLHAQGKDARALASTKICAVGPATATALKEQGIIVDLLPKEYLTSAVVAKLGEQGISGARVLLPRTDIVGEDMAGGLEALGATVDQVVAYRTVASKELPDDLVEDLHKGRIDIITFASSSTVRNLVSLLNGDISLLSKTKIASIGPITSKMAGELGLHVDIEAQEHTISGLVDAIVEALKL
ncbi:MAG: uroporphyrinogen-III C-methyltransferase [Dehalococcoidia bacterium]|nr:uroporphyrinogen-III C-methyltransferase [Dehalococcoidia bacterium]